MLPASLALVAYGADMQAEHPYTQKQTKYSNNNKMMMKRKGEKQEGEEEEKELGRRFNLTYSLKHLDTFDNSARVG